VEAFRLELSSRRDLKPAAISTPPSAAPKIVRAIVTSLVSEPRVTVLMAVFNGASFLAEAVDSVLAQTFRDFELILINDGSQDASLEIAASYRDPRVRLVDNKKNLGISRSLNRGLALSRGEYVANLDADDVAFPSWLDTAVGYLDAHAEAGFVAGQAVPIDSRGRTIRSARWWYPEWRLPIRKLATEWYGIFDSPFNHSSVMYRLSAIQSVGGYAETHPLEADAELCARLERRYALANLSQRFVARRIHGASATGDPERPERRGYAERRAEIVHAQMKERLRWEDVPRRWAQLWGQVKMPRGSMDPQDAAELLDALDRCATRFFELHPETRRDAEIARHRTSMVARVLDKLGTANRRLSLAGMAKMLCLDPASALRALPRVLAVATTGDAVARFVRRRRQRA
jgi:glycosyltransferase involved in cell wall biosynthesis